MGKKLYKIKIHNISFKNIQNAMFVVIDGVDASGKTTQIELLKIYLSKNNKTFDAYDFPQYEKKSSFLVKEYLNGTLGNLNEITAKQASILFAVDRFYIKNNILKSIKEKDFVFSNRYTTSNIIHQATKYEDEKLQNEIILFIENLEYDVLGLPKPSKVLFLDMHIDIIWGLSNKRGGGKGRDIHELNYNYLKNSYFRSLKIAKKMHWDIIKCYENNKPKTIEQIQNIIQNKLGI